MATDLGSIIFGIDDPRVQQLTRVTAIDDDGITPEELARLEKPVKIKTAPDRERTLMVPTKDIIKELITKRGRIPTYIVDFEDFRWIQQFIGSRTRINGVNINDDYQNEVIEEFINSDPEKKRILDDMDVVEEPPTIDPGVV